MTIHLGTAHSGRFAGTGRDWRGALLRTAITLTAAAVLTAATFPPGITASAAAPICGGKVATISTRNLTPTWADETTHIGTNGPDVIVGTPGRDVIMGMGGGDTICGLGGDDLIYGHSGDDVVQFPFSISDTSDDVLYGGDGDDYLAGQDGDDALDGGAGNDEIEGGRGSDSLIGGLGRDDVYGEDGNDTLQDNDGDDALDGNAGRDACDSGVGQRDILNYCEVRRDTNTSEITPKVNNRSLDAGHATPLKVTKLKKGGSKKGHHGHTRHGKGR